jgi:hypothetical protein
MHAHEQPRERFPKLRHVPDSISVASAALSIKSLFDGLERIDKYFNLFASLEQQTT